MHSFEAKLALIKEFKTKVYAQLNASRARPTNLDKDTPSPQAQTNEKTASEEIDGLQMSGLSPDAQQLMAMLSTFFREVEKVDEKQTPSRVEEAPQIESITPSPQGPECVSPLKPDTSTIPSLEAGL